jgi:hypothetical protein
MNAAVLRGDIERALDDLVAQEEGMRFQSLAVILGKRRWPELIASERRWDQGRDAYVPASRAPDGKGKALVVSITPTLVKLKADAAEILRHVDDVSLLIFVTPAPISNHTVEGWAAEIRSAYGYDLVVIPREEIIAELLTPHNAPLCRNLLGLPVPIEPSIAERLERARAACAAEAAAWAAHPRLVGRPRIGLRAVRLVTREGDTTESLDLPEVRSLLAQGRRVTLEAPAGRGKTTALIELATTHADLVGLSVLVDFPAWVRSRQNLLAFLAGTRPFLAQAVTAADLAVLSESVPCAFLLNGWNEVPEQYSDDAITALMDLERAFPAAGIVIATRTHHITPPLPGAARLQLLPLTRAQRRAYLDNALAQEAGTLAELLERDEVLDDLTRTPFILAEVVTLFRAGTPIPRTRSGVLHAVMALIEATNEHRAPLQGPPLVGSARDYLMALAVTMTATGGAALSEPDARRVVAEAGAKLRDAGQISTVPSPASILSALTAHHVLERIDSPGPSFRFEHQQFQEFFAAARLTRDVLAILPNDHTAQQRLAADYLNWPVWEDALYLVAEELGPNDRVDTTDASRTGRWLIEGALALDPIFAASLARRCGPTVWRETGDALGRHLRAWYRTNDPHHRRCALAAILATGAPDFVDLLLPLLTAADHSIRLETYRAAGEFHVSSLGLDWRRLVAEWREECRVDFVSHLGSDFAEDFALNDPSRVVRLAAVERLSWRGPTASLTRVLASLDPGTFEHLLRRRIGRSIPAALHDRARETYRALLEEAHEPVERLRLLVALTQVGGADAIPLMQAELTNLPSGRIGEEAAFSLRAVLTEIRRVDALWASDWVVARMVDGTLWRAEWAAFVVTLSPAQRDGLLGTIISSERPRVHIAHDLLSRTADADVATRAFRMLCELRRTRPPDEARHQSDWNLRRLLKHLPPAVTGAGVARALSDEVFDSVEYVAVIDVFMGTHATEANLRAELDRDDRQRLRDYLKHAIPWVLSQEDFSGTLKMDLAAAVGRISDPEDLPELLRLVQADLARVRDGRAAWRTGDRSSARAQGAMMRCANWHVGALITLDPDRADTALLELLWEPEYEDDVAVALVRLAVPERRQQAWMAPAVDYDAVWAARADSNIGSRRRRYAAELTRRLEALLAESEGSTEPGVLNVRLKHLAVRLAALDAAGSAPQVLEVMARSSQSDEGLRIAALEALLLGGAALPVAAVLPVLEPVVDYLAGRGRYENQARGLLQRCHCVLPFVDPAAAGIARVRQLLGAMPLYGYELGQVLTALGHSRSPDALALLLEIAGQPTAPFSEFSQAWIDALVALGTPDSQQVLLGALDSTVGSVEVAAILVPEVQAPVVMCVAQIARARPDIRNRILQLCDHPLSPARRTLLAAVIAALGERDAVLAGLNLIGDSTAPPVPEGIRDAVERAALEHRPLGSGAYSLEPASAQDIRRRLFDMAVNDERRQRTALALLGQIEEWRLDYGRPGGEPRHPDIDAGVPWPPLDILV